MIDNSFQCHKSISSLFSFLCGFSLKRNETKNHSFQVVVYFLSDKYHFFTVIPAHVIKIEKVYWQDLD